MAAANYMFQPGAQSANWFDIYCNSMSTGTVSANTLISNGNLSVVGRIAGNSLLLDDDDVSTNWVDNTVVVIPVQSLKGQLDINCAGVQSLVNEYFSVRLTSANITANHQVMISPTLDVSSLTVAEMQNFKANVNIQTACIAGEAIITFTALTTVPTGGVYGVGAVLSFNVLIC